MKSILKEILAGLIMFIVFTVIILGLVSSYKLATGSVFIDKEYIEQKEGGVVSQLATDQLVNSLKTLCKGNENARLQHKSNDVVIATALCGSYSDIKRRQDDVFIKGVIQSCKHSKDKDYCPEGADCSIISFVNKEGRADFKECEYTPKSFCKKGESCWDESIIKSSLFVEPSCEHRNEEALKVIEQSDCKGTLYVKVGGEDCKITYKCNSDLNIGE